MRARALALAQEYKLLRVQDAEAQGIDRSTLVRLANQGLLDRLERGLYRWTDAPFYSHETLTVVAHRLPKAVFCLLTALQFHNIGTQLPRSIWITVPRGTPRPYLDSVDLEVIQSLPDFYSLGIEKYLIEGFNINVYSIEKTLVDCFKYRNRIGMEIVLEALRDTIHNRKINIDKLWVIAGVCRMQKVMEPYLKIML